MLTLYISYYDCIQLEDGFYSRNKLLMVKQSYVQLDLFITNNLA